MGGFLERHPRLASFVEGLTTPTTGSFFAMLAVAAIEFGAAAAVVTPTRLATLSSRFLKVRDSDDFARTTIDALKMKYRNEQGLQVVYMGTSVARLALEDTDFPDRLSAQLSQRVGVPVTFWNLTANNEQAEEYVILTDCMPEAYRGAVIAMVSDNRHGHVERVDGHRRFRTHERLGLETTALGNKAETLGETQDAHTGVYFIDHLGFFAVRREVGLRLGDGPDRDIPTEGRTAPASWARAAKELEHDLLDQNALTQELARIEQFARALKRRDIPLVLLEGPSNPRFDAMKGDWKPTYRKRIQAVARKTGAYYWDLSAEAGISEFDFMDTMHLGNWPVRRHFQRILLGHTADLLRDRYDIKLPPGPLPAALPEPAPTAAGPDLEPAPEEQELDP